MIATTQASQNPWMTYSFGFARQMRDADWDQFPTWYRARCLLTPVPQGISTAKPATLRAAA
jgi:hypothetical protein